tara:strand:- start:77 stop:238 length:162 start_codon:yes stop_codon:yes gene_type:complete
MMLLIIIAWVLLVANAPWWIWACYVVHIVFLFVSWLFNYDPKEVGKAIDKLKK